MAADPVKDDGLLEGLLAGLPRDDAERYREMWKQQPPWGLGERPAVVVVDMTAGFVEEESAKACARAIARLLDVARGAHVPVIYTAPGVYPTDAENGAWLRGMPIDEYTAALPPNLQMAYREGLAHGAFTVDDAVKPVPGEMVLVKPKPSAFYATQLDAILVSLRVDSLIVTGAATGRCVRATVDDAFARNYSVVIPIECVTGGVGISQRVQLLDMCVHQEVIADLASVDRVIDDLRDRTAAASSAN